MIFILVDDMGYGHLSLTGQTKFQTPQIDLLAHEGMFFTNDYAGSAEDTKEQNDIALQNPDVIDEMKRLFIQSHRNNPVFNLFK